MAEGLFQGQSPLRHDAARSPHQAAPEGFSGQTVDERSGAADRAAEQQRLDQHGLAAARRKPQPLEPPDQLRAHYAERGLAYLEPTTEEVRNVERHGVRAVVAPVIDKWSGPRDLWLKQDTIRHDAARVATALLRLVEERRPRLRALP